MLQGTLFVSAKGYVTGIAHIEAKVARNETPTVHDGTATSIAAVRADWVDYDWVDYAKGICIILVVMMHATVGVEAAAGRESFMHVVVAFAKPFCMPGFFLISGLFLPHMIARDWRTYLDRKVIHFAYFYILWM